MVEVAETLSLLGKFHKKGYLKDFQAGNAKPGKKKSSKENPFKEIINYMLHCIYFLRFILMVLENS